MSPILSIPSARRVARLIVVTALALSLVALVVPLPAAHADQPAQSTLWTVEYYNNTNLSGYPVYTTQAASIGFNWTADPPAPGVPADNYSMRYTGLQTLSGMYLMQVRADDGVRVYLDGQLVINAFGPSSGLTYTYQFNAAPGQHIIVVEYYEGGGVAFLHFSLTPAGSAPTPVPNPGYATGTVTNAYVLNVRQIPDPYTGVVLTKIYRGQSYPIIGRNAAGTWWQLNVNGVVGWVNGKYISAVNTQGVPITDGGSVPTPGTYTAIPTLNLNIRSGPGTEYGVVGWITAYQQARVNGRNAAGTWWNVTYGSTTGWISGTYTTITPAPNLSAIPVINVGPVVTPSPPPSVVTAGAIANLNIRSGPNVAYPRVGWLPANQMVQVIGRSGTVNWYQIYYNGIYGWVNGSYLSFTPGTNPGALPITG